MRIKLGVNIDHAATLRQVRYKDFQKVSKHSEPRLIEVIRAVEQAGADGITIHLREDRRHIQDDDVWLVRKSSRLPLNLEMAVHPAIIRIALKVKPDEVCIVPERRQEVTTEGGLDVIHGGVKLRRAIHQLKKARIRVSLFINPDLNQVRASVSAGADEIELHTGSYAEAGTAGQVKREWKRLKEAAILAHALGLKVNAGHGLRLNHLSQIRKIPHLQTLNIGHSLVSLALLVGMKKAVRCFIRKMA